MASGKNNYFRHSFFARDDIKLMSFMESLGRKSKEGYFYYFSLLELIGAQCGGEPQESYKVHTQTLRNMWATNAKGVRNVCDLLTQHALVVCDMRASYVILEVPNYSKYLGKYNVKVDKRKEKKTKENKINEKKINTTVNPNSSVPAEHVLTLWNTCVIDHGLKLSKAKALNQKRRNQVKAATNAYPEMQTLEGWKIYFEKINKTNFLIGLNDRGWRADFDWVISQNNILKVVEGRYETLGTKAESIQAKINNIENPYE